MFGFLADLAPLRTDAINPCLRITTEYGGLGGHPAGVEDAMSTRGVTYQRDYVLEYADTWPASLKQSVRALEPTLGIKRPIRVERVAEITPFRVQTPFLSASCSYGALHPVPMKINIIQYSCASAKPLPPSEVVKAFDLVPSMVTMQVAHSLAPSFAASEEARKAIRSRELRLSKYAFGPSADGSPQRLEEAILKQVNRIAKYQRYGFELRPPPPRDA